MTLPDIVDLSPWSNRLLWLPSEIPLSDFTGNARIQVQTDLVTLATVKVMADIAFLTSSLRCL